MKELDFIRFTVLPVQVLLTVVFVIGAIYVILKLLKRYLFVLVKSEDWNRKIEASGARISTSVWIFTGFLLLIYMLNNSFLVTLVMLAVILVIGGKYWRDIINGLVVKFENRIEPGDFLTNDQYTGVIMALGFRGVNIRLESGDLAFISYRNLNDFKVRKLEQELKSEMISINFKFKPDIPVAVAVKKLKVETLQIPYTMLTQSVKVEVVDLDETGSLLRVLVHSQSAETGKLVELALRQVLFEKDLLTTPK